MQIHANATLFPNAFNAQETGFVAIFWYFNQPKLKKNCSTLCVDIDFGRLRPRSFIVPFIAIFIG